MLTPGTCQAAMRPAGVAVTGCFAFDDYGRRDAVPDPLNTLIER